MKFIVFLLLQLLLRSTSLFALPATDFDADGISDLTAVQIQDDEDETLAWSYFSSVTSAITELADYGENGDHLAPAHWLVGGTTQLALVRKNTAGDALEWTLSDSQGTLTFGEDDDTFLAGGDFDGSGLADAAVIDTRESKLFWKIKFDPFASTPGAESEEIEFGVSGDTPFYANVEGEGDWLGVVDATNRLVKFKNPSNSEERSFSIPTAYVSFGRPVPVAQDNGIDIPAFSKRLGSKITVAFFNITTGRRIARPRVRGNGTIVVGDFDSSKAGEEVASHTATGFIIRNPMDRTLSRSSAVVDIPVDEININAYSGTSEEGSIEGCSAYDPNDGSKIGFVWKPNSDTTYYAVAVLSGVLYDKVGKVETFTSSGEKIKQLTFTGCGNPDSTGIRCNHKDFSLTGANYKQQYGSIILKVTLKDGGCGTYFIENPARRTD